MSNDDFITGSIRTILLNGINLYLESEEEEQHYIIKLFEYLDVETEFPTYLRKGHILEIENLTMQVAVEIMITNSTLYFVPYINDVFDIFTEILKFIAHKHQAVITEFRGAESMTIESLKELKKVQNEKTDEIKKTEEEPSSDDDFEWI